MYLRWDNSQWIITLKIWTAQWHPQKLPHSTTHTSSILMALNDTSNAPFRFCKIVSFLLQMTFPLPEKFVWCISEKFPDRAHTWAPLSHSWSPNFVFSFFFRKKGESAEKSPLKSHPINIIPSLSSSTSCLYISFFLPRFKCTKFFLWALHYIPLAPYVSTRGEAKKGSERNLIVFKSNSFYFYFKTKRY